MKRFTPFIVVGAAALLVGLGASGDASAARGPLGEATHAQDDSNDELAAKVAELEERVAALESWTQAQAAHAESLEASLAQAEAAGFTAGINPRSREILLAAWRAGAEAAREKVPGADEESDESDDRRGRR